MTSLRRLLRCGDFSGSEFHPIPSHLIPSHSPSLRLRESILSKKGCPYFGAKSSFVLFDART
jgi:hypothetical protein